MSLVASTNDQLENLPVDPVQQQTFNEKKMLDTIYPLSEIIDRSKELKEKELKEKELKEKELKEKESTEKELKEKQLKEEKDKKDKKRGNMIKHVIIATLLYLFFQIPFIDSLIIKILPSDKFYQKLALKTFLFMTFYFIMTHLFLTSE